MAKTKTASTESETVAVQPKVSKAEAVKQAFAKLGGKATSAEIQAFAKDQFGLNVSGTYIYMVKKEMGKKPGAKRGPKPKAKVEMPTAKVEVHAGNGKATGGISLGDIQVIKDLTDRLGAGDLQALIGMLAK